MRLKKSRAATEEELTALVNKGWQCLNEFREDYKAKRKAKTFDSGGDNGRYAEILQKWADQVEDALREIFPTEREVNTFANPQLLIEGSRLPSGDTEGSRHSSAIWAETATINTQAMLDNLQAILDRMRVYANC